MSEDAPENSTGSSNDSAERLRLLLARGPTVMGILNVTPDSFADGGAYARTEQALEHAWAMMEAGAGIIDIGGESTRPGALPVVPALEQTRVLPVIEALAPLAGDRGVLLSIDTRNASTMRKALAAGAHIVNDVTALTGDHESAGVVARSGAPVILMHMQGKPQTMQAQPHYLDVVAEVYHFFEQRLAACAAAGIDRERVVLDPGIGFGKDVHHNVTLLNGLDRFQALGCPVMIGVSRKSFLRELTGAPVEQRVPGSLAAALAAFQKGARLFRVHDVAETVQALTVWQAVAGGADLKLG